MTKPEDWEKSKVVGVSKPQQILLRQDASIPKPREQNTGGQEMPLDQHVRT